MAFAAGPGPAGAQPGNDSFNNAIPINGSTNVIASNTGATAEPSEPAHAGEPARASVWWRGTAPSTGTFSFSTSNSTFDTVLVVYRGNSVSKLVPVMSNDDFDFGLLWSRVFFRAYAGETFHIVVDGSAGATGTIELRIAPITQFMSPWDLPALDGQHLYSSNFAGKVLLIDFWETTCAACVEELPNLVNMQNVLQPQGFSIIGLSIDPDDYTVLQFLRTRAVPYPIARTTPSVEYIASSIPASDFGMPTKFFVDREGHITGRYSGANPISLYEEVARALLRPSPFPRLTVARTGGSVTISWPGIDAGDQIQAAGQLPAPSWTSVNAPVQVTNGNSSVTILMDGSAQYFRLKRN